MRSDKVFALFALVMFTVAGCTVCIHHSVEDADAAIVGGGTASNPYTRIECTAQQFYYAMTNGQTIYIQYGSYVNITDFASGGEEYGAEITLNYPAIGLSRTGAALTGTINATTDTMMDVWLMVPDIDEIDTTHVSVKVSGQPSYTITFDSRGGSACAPQTYAPGAPYGTLPVPMKNGYTFAGWYYTDGGSEHGPVGPSWTAFRDLTFYAKWMPNEIQYAPPSGNLAAGSLWTHQISTTSGVSVVVSGVSWIQASGGVLSGTPPAAGDYSVTVSMTAANHLDRTEIFTLHVVPQLVPTNSPISGAIIFV